MSSKDLIKRGALEKLEEIVRSCLESRGRNIDFFQLEFLEDVFSPEEHAEIDSIISKLQNDKEYLKLFILFRGI